jgi:hypothetical protein
MFCDGEKNPSRDFDSCTRFQPAGILEISFWNTVRLGVCMYMRLASA